eukprot:Clim_evm16s242 gene=Clim_evmTU16s242
MEQPPELSGAALLEFNQRRREFAARDELASARMQLEAVKDQLALERKTIVRKEQTFNRQLASLEVGLKAKEEELEDCHRRMHILHLELDSQRAENARKENERRQEEKKAAIFDNRVVTSARSRAMELSPRKDGHIEAVEEHSKTRQTSDFEHERALQSLENTLQAAEHEKRMIGAQRRSFVALRARLLEAEERHMAADNDRKYLRELVIRMQHERDEALTLQKATADELSTANEEKEKILTVAAKKRSELDREIHRLRKRQQRFENALTLWRKEIRRVHGDVVPEGEEDAADPKKPQPPTNEDRQQAMDARIRQGLASRFRALQQEAIQLAGERERNLQTARKDQERISDLERELEACDEKFRSMEVQYSDEIRRLTTQVDQLKDQCAMHEITHVNSEQTAREKADRFEAEARAWSMKSRLMSQAMAAAEDYHTTDPMREKLLQELNLSSAAADLVRALQNAPVSSGTKAPAACAAGPGSGTVGALQTDIEAINRRLDTLQQSNANALLE